jgi:hypothetical protein
MAIIKVDQGVPTAYSLKQLRIDNPNVSFPSDPSNEILLEYNVFPVVEGARPDFDIVTTGPIELIDGVWTQTYTGRDLTPEEKREDMVVSPRQARLALNAAGLLASVDAAIAAMDEPEKTVVTLEWEYATEIQRLSSWVISMGIALGLTETELDNLFIVAKDL